MSRRERGQAFRRHAAARRRLVRAALAFVRTSREDFEGMEGSISMDVPAEFMLLHEAAESYAIARYPVGGPKLGGNDE